MEVLLLKDVPKLGRAGDEVRVSDGFARNYLLPRKLAAPVTEGTHKQAVQIRESRRREVERELLQSKEAAARLDGLTVSVSAKAGEQGKLYGSITAADIAEAVQAQHGVEIDRRRVMLAEPIRELGEKQVEVRFSQVAIATITVSVVKAV
jgi:large subunit ribosomal protein L9